MPNPKPSLSNSMPNLPNNCFKVCATLFLICVAISVITAVIVTIYLEASLHTLPSFYIEKVQIPSLKNPNSYNATKQISNSIVIEVKFEIGEDYVPLIYQDLNMTLYYNSSAVGRAALQGFYTGKWDKVHWRAVVDAAALPWEDAFEKISAGSTVALRAELAVKYWPCGDDRCDDGDATEVVVAADFWVDSSGAGVSRNPIRLH